MMTNRNMTKEELLKLNIEPPDKDIYTRVRNNLDRLAKPIDGLGVFEHLIAQLGAICKSTKIDISKKAIIVMCADNGIVEEGVSQSGSEVTLAVTKAMGKNQSSVGKMAVPCKIKVIPVDIGINTCEDIFGVLDLKVAKGTKNFLKEPAMTEKEILKAIETGIELVKTCKDSGFTLLGTGEMGIGNTTTSTAVAAALLSLAPKEITGRGAGLDEAALKRKVTVIEQALEKYKLKGKDAFTVLQTVGGIDIAGLTGVFLGAALYRLPVIIDGEISAVAALCAEMLCPGSKAYMLPSHKSREKAFDFIMKKLDIKPVIHADMALGEGTGTVMMMKLLDVSLSLYSNGSSFEQFDMNQYKRFES